MRLIAFLKKLKGAYRGAIQGYKYGGYVKAIVSEINYGGLFTADDVILVSGGSKGIGLSIAKKLIKEGATVIITGRSHSSLKEVSGSIDSDRLHVLELDISKTDFFDSKIAEIEGTIGKPITALINNAGIYSTTHFPDVTEEDAIKVYNTNTIGTLLLSQCLCKRWNTSESHRIHKIINISSQGGFVGANNAYRMTKWGIRGLTAYMGKALSRRNIIVNGVAPGIVLTDMQPNFKKQGDNLSTPLTPTGRIALPMEIAELVAFLLSNAANNIVGQTICCDGGYSLN